MARGKRLRQPRNLIALAILISLITGGVVSGNLPPGGFASAQSQRFISLYVDGQTRTFGSSDATVGDVLKDNGVIIDRGDLVEPDQATVMTGSDFNINVYRARPVVVIDGYETYHVLSAYQSPRLLAQAAGLTVYPEDTYSQTTVTDIVGTQAVGDQVTIHRATPINIVADGKTQVIRTQLSTVGAALKAAGIAVGLSDILSPRASAPVIAGQTVVITRVSTALATISTPLPRTTVTTIDPNLLEGQTVVTNPGADGAKVETYRIHYTNGVETSRELIAVVQNIPAVARTQEVGSEVLFAGSVEYWRPLVEAAAAQWNFDPNTMMRIMACESNGNATSVSQFVIDGQHPEGLFQYLPTTWEAAGGTADNILDGATQIQLTAKKMALYGTGPWQCK